MTPLSSTNHHFHHVFLFCVYFVLYSVTTGSDDLSAQYNKRPLAEVDPGAIILRTRGAPSSRSRSTVLTTSPDPLEETYDPSFSDNFPAFWNFSSVAEIELSSEEATGDLPAEEDRGATLEELVLRLEDEVALDDALQNALAARRGRPSSRMVAPGKGKRPKKRNSIQAMFSPLSNKHKAKLLAIHNSYRRKSPGPASNMEEMVWDDQLTVMAKKYAKRCIWAHGQAVDSTEFKHVGQNLAYGTSSPNSVTTPFYLTSLWYAEKSNYNINADTCKPGTMCGHYTQMVWADTNKVGCATQWCNQLTVPDSSMVIRNALYLVCNYGPGGNIHGQKPYEIGRPCTQCASGSGKCRDGLCSDCNLRDRSCDCMLQCQNGGVLDEQTCTCSCPAGWMGPACNDLCNNSHPWCGNGWPKEWCFIKSDDNPVEELCPALCGVCECGGPPCQNGGVKSEVTCQCDCVAPWSGEDCSVCKTSCDHGTMDESSCHCTCDDGWMGPTCSETCRNKHQLCYHGWYPNWCDDDHPYVKKNCPAMCGQCRISSGGNTRHGPCQKSCQHGGNLRQDSCECDCTPGWFGDECTLECRDEFHHCQWTKSLCNNHDYARHYCPVSCELCPS